MSIPRPMILRPLMPQPIEEEISMFRSRQFWRRVCLVLVIDVALLIAIVFCMASELKRRQEKPQRPPLDGGSTLTNPAASDVQIEIMREPPGRIAI